MLNRGLDKLELLRIVEAVANEKSIDKELVIGSMESAIQKAALTKFGNDNNIEVTIDRNSGEITIKKVLEIVETYSSDSVSFYEFIEDININFSKDEKISLLKFMWDIAYADGKLDVDEERLVRRVADLIKIKSTEVLKLKDLSKNNTNHS